MTTMTEVLREERAGVEHQIAAELVMRNSQRPNSDNYEEFQSRIDSLTSLRLWYDEVIPKLAVLDEQERLARGTLHEASSQLDFAEGVEHDRVAFARRVAGVAGALGALLTLIALMASPPWWVLVAGTFALVGAVALFGWSVWWQSAGADRCQVDLSGAQEVLDDIELQRDQLLRGRRVAIARPDPVTVVQELLSADRTLALNPGGEG